MHTGSMHIYTHTPTHTRTGGKFDQLTGTSITDDILNTLDVSGVGQLLEYLMDLFCNPASLADNRLDRL